MHAAIDQHRSQATQSERNAFQLGANAQRGSGAWTGATKTHVPR